MYLSHTGEHHRSLVTMPDQGLCQGVEHDILSSFMYSNIFNQKMDHKSWHLNSSVRWYSTFFVQVLTTLAKKSISEENKTVHELLVYMMYKGLFYLQFPGQTLRIVLASPTTSMPTHISVWGYMYPLVFPVGGTCSFLRVHIF